MSERHKSYLQQQNADPTDPGQPRLFLLAQIVWLSITVPLVMSFGITQLESVFVLVFVGWLSACVLFEPTMSTPRWWRIAGWVTRGGFLLLGYFVFLRSQELGIL